eukprot:CAMPEP_0181236590 /NCGR_PEP_ID=MMETSP1096-20121128/38269_1 /TAXON_ID=156174 ORGANISM="Chrysochromulina ericina, Strain CCMP281" /NCGR_SAMPLE_ID=MMETSP1096 /ASSEMBLY_ACC=CAM_ASM_000453 /LENGTH=49 /DNA_ID=CAMNT_0023331805 /DNA_START=402 /DNA_END=551 /DNA_ORIENTATION=-
MQSMKSLTEVGPGTGITSSTLEFEEPAATIFADGKYTAASPIVLWGSSS